MLQRSALRWCRRPSVGLWRRVRAGGRASEELEFLHRSARFAKGYGEAMHDLELTYTLAAVHLLVSVGAILCTRYPVITVFHLFWLTHALGFGVRPILAAIVGGYTLYPVAGGWEAYNKGLAYGLIFALSYAIGYLLFRGRCHWGRKALVVGRGTTSMCLLSAVLGCGALLAMHYLSRGAWMPSVRSVSITAAVPLGKILFPLAVIPLTLVPAFGYLGWREQHRTVYRVLSLLVVGPAAILLVLLYQRGFLILGLLLLLFLYERLNGLGYLRAGLSAGVLVVLLVVSRPLALSISDPDAALVTFSTGGTGIVGMVKSFCLFSPNFDGPDVFAVAVQFVEENGLLLGRTLGAIPGRFLTPTLRRDFGLTTAVDALNAFYWGEKYWSSRFGFGVGLMHELYINFGLASLLLGMFPGIVTFFLDRWLFRVSQVEPSLMYLIAAGLFSGGFTSEIAGTIAWGFTFAAVGFLVGMVARVRLLPR